MSGNSVITIINSRNHCFINLYVLLTVEIIRMVLWHKARKTIVRNIMFNQKDEPQSLILNVLISLLSNFSLVYNFLNVIDFIK